MGTGVTRALKRFGAALVPRTVTAQFALLLVVALLVANVVALLVVGSERARVAREVRRGAQIERLAGIAAVMEQVPPHLRAGIAATTSSPFLHLNVADTPILEEDFDSLTARAVASRLRKELVEAGFEAPVRVAADEPPVLPRMQRPWRREEGAAAVPREPGPPAPPWWDRPDAPPADGAAPVEEAAAAAEDNAPTGQAGGADVRGVREGRRAEDARRADGRDEERGEGGRGSRHAERHGGHHRDGRGAGDGPGRHRPPSIVASIPFGDGMWLNAELPLVDRGPPVDGRAVMMTLGFSLLFVLGVGITFTRRLTRPIRSLAAAAERAGEGDRSATAAVAGPAEVRRAAEAFNAMQGRIAQFDAERARTIAAVGHDLRTPITSLRIRAEMLDDEERDAMVRTLDEMRVMAEGLLAYGRAEAEHEARTLVDLAALLKDQAVGGIRYEGPDSLMVEGRPVALSRAFANLAENARRYAGSGRIRLVDRAAATTVVLDDDGPGIPEERLAEVLEPFVRLDPSRSSETGGAGLGLSIARTIIRAHGGTLTLENRPEGGLRVTIVLPRDPLRRGRPGGLVSGRPRRGPVFGPAPANPGGQAGESARRALAASRRRERVRAARMGGVA